MKVFRRVYFALLLAAGVAIAVSWGARPAFVYASFVALTASTAYGAAIGSEFLRRLSARRFVAHRPPGT